MKAMKVGIFILFLILAFKIRYDANCGHVTYRLYSVEVSSSCTEFVESFYHNWMSIFIKCFFLHILSWSGDFHPLFWMWCITLVVGVTSTSSLHSWNKSLFVKNIYLFRSWLWLMGSSTEAGGVSSCGAQVQLFWDLWNPSSMTKDQTHISCIAR